MIPYSDAERLARLWVDVTNRGTGALHEDAALEKPHGGVFFWDGRESIETRNPRKRLLREPRETRIAPEMRGER